MVAVQQASIERWYWAGFGGCVKHARHESATHDSVRQLNLSQWTHPSPRETPPNRAENAILASCCVKRLLHDSLRQLDLAIDAPLPRNAPMKLELNRPFGISLRQNVCVMNHCVNLRDTA